LPDVAVRIGVAFALGGSGEAAAFDVVEAAYLGDAGAGAELTGPLRRLGPELDTFAMIPAPRSAS
jgi:hypothetical protein